MEIVSRKKLWTTISSIILLTACGANSGQTPELHKSSSLEQGKPEIQSQRKPFSCDGYAYLIQGDLAGLNRFNPITSEFSERWSDQHTGEINAIGFRPKDGFLYGWDTDTSQLVRISNETTAQTSVEILNDVPPIPASQNFITGDVFKDHIYLFSNTYVYKHSLSNLKEDWEKIELTLDNSVGSSWFPSDVAFMPNQGSVAYGVKTDKLIKFDLVSRQISQIATLGFSGGFGGAYADDSEFLYVSDNDTGKMYKINVNTPSDWEEVGDSGVSTRVNDGAHCVEAPVGSFRITYKNVTDSADVFSQIEEQSGNLTSVGDMIPSGFSNYFNENSPEMVNLEVSPGMTKKIAYKMDGETVECGDFKMSGPMIFRLKNSQKIGQTVCTKLEDMTSIHLSNNASLPVYPAFDVGYGYAADSMFGWLNSGMTKVYYPDDGFMNTGAINIHENDTINGFAALVNGTELVECATNLVFNQAYYFHLEKKDNVTVCVSDH
ncbi:hypothetical protein HWQ46_21000 [Shewanella sp. D64]|uniref:DUF6923 family protein n=1 Tax=unclassified Shewanella TaxID=196818 RepID=UPI0022BA4247|nr:MULTISPECIES: hypothetical protein [unclassified Shewanella]MEC4728018.1 hypothetical protein [Shewanella sp. D64]MEC4740137.1 hypothetical protein [Shewanella sp. E94]WBJ95198.1 hypothetical protein HWQ47_25920 [Shewanella sp. MTB7]